MELPITYKKWFDIRPYIKKYPKYDKWVLIKDRQCGGTVSSVKYAYDQYLKNGKYFFVFRRTTSLIENAITNDFYEEVNDHLTWTMSGIFERKPTKDGYTTGRRVGSIKAYNISEYFRGGSYDKYGTIIIDEITTERITDYLADEDIKLSSVLTSVISRHKKKVIMLGNASNFESPVLNMLGVTLKNMPSRGYMKFFPDSQTVVMYVGDNEFLRSKYEEGTLKAFSKGNKTYENYAFGEASWSLTNNIIVNPHPNYKLDFVCNFSYMNNKFAWYQGKDKSYLSKKLGNGKMYGLHKIDQIDGIPFAFETYGPILANLLRNKRLEVQNLGLQELLKEIIKKA